MTAQAHAAPSRTPTLGSTLWQMLREAFDAKFRNRFVVHGITPFERLVMHWLYRRILYQSSWPMANLTDAFTELSRVARTTFPEDNDPTVDFFLRDCLEKAIGKTSCAPVRKVD